MMPWQESRLRILEQRLGQSKRKIREQQISIFSLEQMASMMSQMHGTGDGPAGPAPVACTPCNILRVDQTLTITYQVPSGNPAPADPFGTNTVALPMAYEATNYSMILGNGSPGGSSGPFTVPNPHWTSPCHVFSDSIFNYAGSLLDGAFSGHVFSNAYWRFLFGCFNNGTAAQVALAAVYFDPTHDTDPSYESASSRCANYPSSTAQFHRPDGGVVSAFGAASTGSMSRSSAVCSPFEADFQTTNGAFFLGGSVFKYWWDSLVETIP